MATVSRNFVLQLLRNGVPVVRGPAISTLDVTCYRVRRFKRAPRARVVQWPKCADDEEMAILTEAGNDPIARRKGPCGEGAVVKAEGNDPAEVRNLLSVMIGEQARSVHFDGYDIHGEPENYTDEEIIDKKFYWHRVLDMDPVKLAALRRDLAYSGGRQ